MRVRSLLCFMLAAIAVSGCASQFMGTAPAATPQSSYVVGSYDSEAAIWLCKQGAKCSRVAVSD